MADSRQDSQRLALLQAALDQIEQGFTVFDAELEMIGWNRRFFELLEFPESLARTGTHFSAFMRYNAERGEYGEGDIEALVAERVERARGFRPHEMERRRPNGEVLAIRGTPLPGGGFVTTYTDVTAERQRQAALEREVAERTRALSDSEARLRLITDAVPALIAYVDDRATFRFANRRYAAWFGRTVEGILGETTSSVFDEPLRSTIAQQLARALQGQETTYEYRRVGPDGNPADMRSILIPDVGADGRVTGCFVLSLDITEQKAREAALRQAQKMEAVGQLTGGIAHDFNNLLTVILGNLESLRSRLADEALVQDCLEPALHAARRGAELTGRLLAFARERPLAPRPVDVEAAIANLSRLLRRSLPSTIEVSMSGRGLPPPALVDPGQLDNALLNLALNARDAIGGPGRIVFCVAEVTLGEREAASREVAPGRYVRVEVEDSGGGIDRQALPRIFDPFFTTKEFGTGSGLGLSMVYGFIRQSGGAIEVASAPGAGTKVTMLLPAAAEQPAAAPAETRAGPAARPQEPTLVLLVEDDPQVRAVLRRQLTDIGHRVLEAENSEDALELIGSIPEIRYLVSDVVMPGQMDGMALAQAAKALAPGLQVALITGYAGVDRPEGCPFPILGKPFTDSELRSLIARAA